LFFSLPLFALQSSTDQATVDTDISYRVAGLVFALIQLISVIALLSNVAWPVFLLFLASFTISVWYQVRINFPFADDLAINPHEEN
jgi:hypothetical protein